MINEILVVSILVLNVGFMILSWRLGMQYFVVLLAINVVLSELFAGSLVSLLGVTVGVSAIFYPFLFAMTNVVNEHKGKAEAQHFASFGLFALILMLLLTYLGLNFVSIPETADVSESLTAVMSMTVRVIVASILAYVVGQKICIYVYAKMKEKMQGSHIWLRNAVSNTVAQAVDSVIFYPIAFYSLISDSALITILLTGWIGKSLVATLITPTLYVTKKDNR